MFEVWDGDLFLFAVNEDEVLSFIEQGFTIVDNTK
jgi:hypothetical protein